jgi:hypothetical protein
MISHSCINHIIVPIFDQLGSEENVDSEHEICLMIRRNEHLRDHFNDPRLRKKIDEILDYRGVRFTLSKFGSRLETSNEKIMASVPWWMDRLKESKPSLYNAIDLEPAGRIWFGAVLVDMVALIREYL